MVHLMEWYVLMLLVLLQVIICHLQRMIVMTDGQIKVTYELMLDQALKKERQNQIRDSQLEAVEEPLTISRGKLYMTNHSLITNNLQFVIKISRKPVGIDTSDNIQMQNRNGGSQACNQERMQL